MALVSKKQKVALIHIAKKETGVSDEQYKAILSGAAGIETSGEIEYEAQFRAIVTAFEKLGFKSSRNLGKTTSRPQWLDAWGSTKAQRAKIEAMWRTVARDKSDRALWSFVKRITGYNPPYINIPLARDVIIALAKMMKAAGYDPETGERVVVVAQKLEG